MIAPLWKGRGPARLRGRQRRWRRLIRWRLLLGALALIGVLTALPLAGALAYHIENHPEDQVTGLFSVSPTEIDIDAVPGQTVDSQVTIANRTGNPLNVTFSTEDFTGSSDPDVPTVLLGDATSPQGARDWLQPEIPQITMNQGDSLTLNVRTAVPPNAEPGGHYAVFLASFMSQATGPQGTGVNVVSRVGCFFLIRVAGAAIEQGSLDSPEVSGFSWRSPVNFGLIFRNQGNVHLKPSGTLRIKNLLGMTVSEVDVPSWTVLPDAARRTQVQWDSNLMFGRYTAEAQVDYGSGPVTIASNSAFWAFSWPLLVALFGFLALLTLVIIWWLRHRRAREEEQSHEAGAASAEAPAETAGAAAPGPPGAAPPGPAVVPGGPPPTPGPAPQAAPAPETGQEPAAGAAPEGAILPGPIITPSKAAAGWPPPEKQQAGEESETAEEQHAGEEPAAAEEQAVGEESTAAEEQATGEGTATAEAGGAAEVPEAGGTGPQLMPLGQLLPSTGDGQLVDVNDPETRNLLAKLIDEELELSRILVARAQRGEARLRLLEIRGAAQRLGFHKELMAIDELLSAL